MNQRIKPEDIRPLVVDWLATGEMSPELIDAVTSLALMACRTLKVRADWRDISQGVFFDLLKAKKIDPDKNLCNYVYTLAKNQILMFWRGWGWTRAVAVTDLKWAELREAEDLFYSCRHLPYKRGGRWSKN